MVQTCHLTDVSKFLLSGDQFRWRNTPCCMERNQKRKVKKSIFKFLQITLHEAKIKTRRYLPFDSQLNIHLQVTLSLTSPTHHPTMAMTSITATKQTNTNGQNQVVIPTFNQIEQNRITKVDSFMQSVFTHVASIYANLLQQKKVFA